MKKLLLILTVILLPSLVFGAPEAVKKLTTQGNAAFGRGDLKEAAKLYNEGLKEASHDPILLYNLGNVRYREGKYQKAMEMYAKALKAAPPRRLLEEIYFNYGNSALQKAKVQAGDKAGLDELQKALAAYELSFQMYRKSLSVARDVSIAEGRDVKRAGLAARKNWALARESWSRVMERIKELQQESMTLEDGVKGLLAAQNTLLPSLEGIYLNSLSDDALRFNLKRLAEYQADYQEDVSRLLKLADKEVEEVNTKIANLKEQQKNSPPKAKGQKSTPPPTGELDELQKRLKNAQEISKAVQKSTGLAEWLIDNLKKGEALAAWENSNDMIAILSDLGKFLEGSDANEAVYLRTIQRLREADALLQDAQELAKEQDSPRFKTARARRAALAAKKCQGAGAALQRINFYLKRVVDTLAKDSQQSAKDEKTKKAAQDKKSPLDKALKSLMPRYAKELENRNETLAQELKEKAAKINQDKIPSLETEAQKAQGLLTWYRELGQSPISLLPPLIARCDEAADRVHQALDAEKTNSSPLTGQELAHLPDPDSMAVILFELHELEEGLGDNATKSRTAISHRRDTLEKAWAERQNITGGPLEKESASQALKAIDGLRLALVRTLLLFSPESAINLYYKRCAALLQNLDEKLPAAKEKMKVIKKRQNYATSEAAALNSLIVSYIDGREREVKAMDNQEKQKTYLDSLEHRRQAVPLLQRLIDAGLKGAGLMDKKRFQEADILLKDMASSLKKSQLAFSEAPKEAQEAVKLAIEQQKRLQEQSRNADSAATVEGSPEAMAPFLAANQEDIAGTCDRAQLLIENMIGMADIPTPQGKGQAKGQAPQKPQVENLKKAMAKIKEARAEMTPSQKFLKAAEFHNTFKKHPQIIKLLQEALDLLQNKEQKDKDKKKGDNKKKNKSKDNSPKKDQGQKKQQKKANHGEQSQQQRQRKPLELSPQEARTLLKELNRQDEKERTQGVPAASKRVLNTPRPW